MGNIEKQQADMQRKLAQFPVEVKQEGLIITGNATKTITNISISNELLESGDKEMIEDLLLTAVNRFIEEASKKEADETKNLMADMLPPGFGDMFK